MHDLNSQMTALPQQGGTCQLIVIRIYHQNGATPFETFGGISQGAGDDAPARERQPDLVSGVAKTGARASGQDYDRSLHLLWLAPTHNAIVTE
jgi:hypothetical protein